MNTALYHLFAILTVVLAFPAATSQEPLAPSSPVPGGCADSVISFSPCLPYISAPPNDLSGEPSSQCCDIFNGAFDSDDAECLCYLVRQNSLLGFPLNVTKLLSLSDLCSLNNKNQTNITSSNNSLDSICSGSPTLPPMIVTPKKPPSGSDARRPPPPPHAPLLHPPPSPSTTTMPRPAVNNGSTQTAANKPSTSDQSNDQDDAFFWNFFVVIMYFIICQNLAVMEA